MWEIVVGLVGLLVLRLMIRAVRSWLHQERLTWSLDSKTGYTRMPPPTHPLYAYMIRNRIELYVLIESNLNFIGAVKAVHQRENAARQALGTELLSWGECFQRVSTLLYDDQLAEYFGTDANVWDESSLSVWEQLAQIALTE